MYLRIECIYLNNIVLYFLLASFFSAPYLLITGAINSNAQVSADSGNSTKGSVTSTAINAAPKLSNESTIGLQSPMVGSFGDDRMVGTSKVDIMIGFLGSDTMLGGDGDDAMQGDEGPDKIFGDKGNDIIQGGVGSDQLYGREGNDILAGGLDDDFISGDAGNDKMYGDIGDDILVGGLGADYFDCGDGVDVVMDFKSSEGDDRAGNCEEIVLAPNL